jgi:hypothetical protein
LFVSKIAIEDHIDEPREMYIIAKKILPQKPLPLKKYSRAKDAK